MELDRIDRMIVVALMTDATLPLARLADRVGLTQTPCWKRLAIHQEATPSPDVTNAQHSA